MEAAATGVGLVGGLEGENEHEEESELWVGAMYCRG